MKVPNKSAKAELLQIIKTLKSNHKTLNYDELIIVLKEMKSIAINAQFIDITIQSLQVLKTTSIHFDNTLTNRETELLALIGKGFQNTAIATHLNLKISTVETHRKNIRRKLKLKGSFHLFIYAFLFNLQNKNTSLDDFL